MIERHGKIIREPHKNSYYCDGCFLYEALRDYENKRKTKNERPKRSWFFEDEPKQDIMNLK